MSFIQCVYAARRKRDTLRTSIVKRLIDIRYGVAYEHMHPYWPHMEIAYSPEGYHKIYCHGKYALTTCSFSDLKTQCGGGEVSIFGAGPSIKLMDLSKIKENSAILVNGAITLADKLPHKPLLCILMDQNFLVNDTNLLKNLPKGSNILLSIAFLGTILRKDKSLIEGQNIFISNNILELYKKPITEISALPLDKAEHTDKTAFSFDPEYGLFDGGTVLTWAIQLSFYFGACVTYILGLDLGNYAAPHFYETEANKCVSIGLFRDYETKILPFMTLAGEIFRKNNLPIFNCSPETKLPYSIFPFSDHFLKEKRDA